MKRLRELNQYRDKAWERRLGADGDDFGGCFRVPSESRVGTVLCIMAGVDDIWDHLSISTELRCPIWAEMEQAKRLFFKGDEYAFQLHAAPTNHISIHPHCLHIWRPHAGFPLPPADMV